MAKNCSVRVRFRNSRATDRQMSTRCAPAVGTRRGTTARCGMRLNGTRAARRSCGLQIENQCEARRCAAALEVLRTPRGGFEAFDRRRSDAPHPVEFRPCGERTPCSAVGDDARGEHRSDAGQEIEGVGRCAREETQRIDAERFGKSRRANSPPGRKRRRCRWCRCGKFCRRWRLRRPVREPVRQVSAAEHYNEEPRPRHPSHPAPAIS
jgi:hypothetical protein